MTTNWSVTQKETVIPIYVILIPSGIKRISIFIIELVKKKLICYETRQPSVDNIYLNYIPFQSKIGSDSRHTLCSILSSPYIRIMITLCNFIHNTSTVHGNKLCTNRRRIDNKNKWMRKLWRDKTDKA